eukprot:CAMPEP_0117750828 /NCGR_PEP_ID=MMETSP0947-20121206/10611_1 /TAXON_ID=44440 /ORGANISM="Chattonella subsalsa, Strain CCMP2191" /LENGTH=87 /DNA_ID=CAMNT_0005569091 /DNA_START=790 /DNA_END=1053 /DNA_ORIENTATION=+
MLFGFGENKIRQSEALVFPSYREEQPKTFWSALWSASSKPVSMVEFYAKESPLWNEQVSEIKTEDISLVGFLDIDPYKACKISSKEW